MLNNCTVLVAEDHDDIRAILRVLLEMKGCEVLEAANGREAVALAEDRCSSISLILMDLKMPVMGGVEATRLIAARAETRHIPVVAVSAHCEGEWQAEVLAAGAVECVRKPVDFALIARIIDRYVRQRPKKEARLYEA